ncbi:hypothetical protein AALP_AA8G050600 [Arabis alpina]|uniref:Uncharacterized protein n=1 Tax=Arabis alpina TaxID=50452 RepID=A0A087G525_ARAAL|nr:hypothetical protein AALP_AA8G050600 [Arabis alpina]
MAILSDEKTRQKLGYLLSDALDNTWPKNFVFKQLNLPPHFSLSNDSGDIPWKNLPPSHKIGTPQPMFKELKDEEVQQYRE